jgi:hypothetical protein
MKKIKYWYFTADVTRCSKKNGKSIETRTFSRTEWSRSEFFPLEEAIKMTTVVLRDRDNFFDVNEEYCTVRVVNQFEISVENYNSLTDKNFGIFGKGGQLV